jgi:HKD family nuclease
MSDKPDFIDNLDGNTMTTALRRILDIDDLVIKSETSNPPEIARIATAYFSPEGFSRIAPAIANLNSIKLLLGTEPLSDNERWRRKLDESNERFVARKLRENLIRQENSLKVERDNIPFTRDSKEAVKKLVDALRAGNMEVRRYEENFLHAKAYIFTSESGDENGAGSLIAGSSNLTAAGFSKNLELNLGRHDDSTISKGVTWFERLWEESVPFDLAAFFEELLEPKTPFEIFLRVLWELYGDEIEEDRALDDGLPLTTFQKHGVNRALRLIDQTGGAIVADEVGLGKTFIAGEILNIYKERRQRVLLICPAALRDSAWKQFQSEFELYLETKSFEEVARDEQLWDEERRPKANSRNLERNIDEYQLIIIDEAHNYRNPDSPYRADALRALLYGKRKDVLMLTATPVNNSLWDLYHLTRFFLRQDSFLASKGILSIKERFDLAMKTDPMSLSPDVLYPIIDATTVKRTRQFVRKHYSGDQVEINGVLQSIVFPEPKAISVRYKIDALDPQLFELVERYFDPEDLDSLAFARYKADTYLRNPDEEDERMAHAVTGLLLSGLLKRFESSAEAFRVSLSRIISQHENFLKALKEGLVVSTKFLKDSAGTNDEDFEELLASSEEAADASLYYVENLRTDVESDLFKLEELLGILNKIKRKDDPKLAVLAEQLGIIASEAKTDSTSREELISNRKVIIFSFYADTARWIKEFLFDAVSSIPSLSVYKDRIEIVVGSGVMDEVSDKGEAAARFAPDTAGKPGDPDLTDILISTDVLAEGVNLQQARHIINYDMPWNPMRLVQRHGRIDRIGSQHTRVFLRTIFPADRLESLLHLEERIAKKIALAAASVGVVSPISGVASSNRDFTETKEEIQKLEQEDSSLFVMGGTGKSIQSGEEYRQTLRLALQNDRVEIMNLPWKSGSGMRKGNERGVFFCAKVGERTYLRFVHTSDKWKVKYVVPEEESGLDEKLVPMIEHEIGRCLRLIECTEETTLDIEASAEDAVYDLWITARENILAHWMYETDPANLQPRVRPLNLKVADFIRSNPSSDIDHVKMSQALDIVESPWSRRDENRLRAWFEDSQDAAKKTEYLINSILDSGLEPFKAPEPLPPIIGEDIKLLVWMAIKD